MPERWQAVLWYTEVEGYTPAATAALIGTTANNVSQIRRRARKRLRALLASQESAHRDYTLGRGIAVALLGASTATMLMPLFKGGAAQAAATTGLGTTLSGQPAVIIGSGVLVAGLIADGWVCCRFA